MHIISPVYLRLLQSAALWFDVFQKKDCCTCCDLAVEIDLHVVPIVYVWVLILNVTHRFDQGERGEE